MGYLKIDDRVSGGALKEWDTTWCRHCQAAVPKNPKCEIGYCSHCGGPLCPPCAKDAILYGCKPFFKELEMQKKRIDENIRRGLFYQQIGIGE